MEQNDINKNFTWQEAKIEMNKGKWVRHRFFSPNEAITIQSSMIRFEDDTFVSVEQFEMFRFNKSNNISDWEKDWSICSAPTEILNN